MEEVGIPLIIIGVLYILFISFLLIFTYKRKRKEFRSTLIASIVFTAVGIIILLIFSFSLMGIDGCSTQSNNEYDNLTDEEKQWYQDNYGNGQYDKYKDAIDEYKDNYK